MTWNEIHTCAKLSETKEKPLFFQSGYKIKKGFDHHSSELKERFWKQGYDQKLVDEQLAKVEKLVKDNI